MAKGFGAETPVEPQPIRNEIAEPSQPIRITFAEPRNEIAEPSQDLATELTYSGVELSSILGLRESTLRNRFKTVLLLVQRGVLTREDLSENGRYTERARHLLESLGAALAADRMGGPRWVAEQAKTLTTFAAMAEAVPVEVVEDEPGYAGAIELYQKQNAQLSTEIGDLTEAVLTDVQALRAQFGQLRQQRRQAIAQQAAQDAVEDFKVYEATYAATAGNLTVAAGNASVA